MTGLSEAAPAKVNLYLHVVGRRADGYHLLDSLAVFPRIADTVWATSADALSLRLAGPFGDALAAEADNLVLRAARALAAGAGIAPRAALVLDKRLPVASGIGGGSADAAAALRVLSRLWNIAPATDELHRIAASLGADVAVCLHGRAVRMGGIGDELSEPPRLPPFGMVLVNPGVPVSTPAVFRTRTGDGSGLAVLPARWPDVGAMAADLARLANDLEAPAGLLCPELAEVLAALSAAPGCRLARMSGSGATCFGLFDTDAAAEKAAPQLRRRGWWVAAG